MITITNGNIIPYIAQRPVSVVIVVMILGALFFALRPKKWESVAEDHEEGAEVRND